MFKKSINIYTLLYNSSEYSAQEKYWTINRNFKLSYSKTEKKHIKEKPLEKKEFVLDTTFGGLKEN